MRRRDGEPPPTKFLSAILRQHVAVIIVLALATVVGALLEAGLLVLLTATLLVYVQGIDGRAPLFGFDLNVSTAPLIGLGIILVRFALSALAAWLSARLTSEVTTDERRRLTTAFLGTPYAVQQQESSGRLHELTSAFVARVSTTVTSFAQGLTAVLSLASLIGMGSIVEPLATLVMLGVLTGLGLVVFPIRKRIRSESAELASTNLEYSRTISELGSLGLEMRTFGVKDKFKETLDLASAVQVRRVQRVQFLSGLLTPIYTLLAFASVLVGIQLIGGLDSDRLAGFGAVLLLLLRSLSYGQQLVNVQASMAATMPFLQRFESEIERYREGATSRGTVRPDSLGDVALNAASLTYPGRSAPALACSTLTIHAGEMLGVIGESGAGKSSFAQLLLGLRQPSSGLLTISGVNQADIDPAYLSQAIAFVPQDAVLITGTVAQNIRFFRGGIDDQAVRESARRAQILELIQEMPDGFDTHLGERGTKLSGGQRQRIAIARALAGKPELIVMDEPTSALDARSEGLVRASLAGMKGRVTIVVIAHRLSTLDLCDRIAVFERGHLTAIDSPSHLYETSAYYRKALDAAGMSEPKV